MPRFAYSAKDSSMKVVEGNLDAASEGEAVEKLSRMGYFPLSLRKEETSQAVSKSSLSFKLFSRIRRRDLSLFLRQLADLLEGGLTLAGAIQVISGQMENPRLQQIVEDIGAQIREGASFSDALAHYPKVFSPLIVSMVKSGEMGGMLPVVLAKLADFGEAEEELYSKVRSAMAYPALILFVGISTIFILLAFVIPKLVSLFQEVGQVLPLPTKILIQVSDLIVSYGWILLMMIVAGVFMGRRMADTQEGKFVLDRIKLRLPIWGSLIRRVETARFARSLGMLLSHGVAILRAVEVVAQAAGNEVMRRGLRQITEQLESGTSLSHGMRESGVFENFVIHMVAVGEEGGTLDRSLIKIGEAYERQADRTMKVMTSLLEPVMILVMGLIVGFIVISMLLPIFEINLLAR